MPIRNEETVEDEGKKWTHFETTPIMSTYLIAYVVADYANLTGKVSNTTIGFWARRNAISQMQYALEIGKQVLPMLEEYLGSPFTLPKLDNLGIPQFSAGAVENWGVITYL